MERLNSIQDMKKLRASVCAEDTGKVTICACGGSACRASGSRKVVRKLKEEAEQRGLDIDIKTTGCRGMCSSGPNVMVEPNGIFYTRVKPESVAPLLSYTVVAHAPYRPLLYRDNILTEPVTAIEGIPLYKKQLRLVLKNNGRIDPRSIMDYIKIGGYVALELSIDKTSTTPILGDKLWLLITCRIFSLAGSIFLMMISVIL